MVARARLGLFSDDDARTAPDEAAGASASTAIEGGWRAKLEPAHDDPLRSSATCCRRSHGPAAYDLILCRNTVIYFAEPIRDELHARLAEALRPGGYLVIGSTERVSTPQRSGPRDATSIHLSESLMDTSEYMPMFLAEAQEHLQELNLAVVALEDDPANQETVDGIFRIAHSLKGMSATMGFSAIAELTHVMEDVFELLRQRAGGLIEEAITTVLACLDALQAAVDSIEQSGSENLDPAPLIEQLRELIRDRTPDQAVERAGGAQIPDPIVVAAVREAGGRILYVKVILDPGRDDAGGARAHGVRGAQRPRRDDRQRAHTRRDRELRGARDRGLDCVRPRGGGAGQERDARLRCRKRRRQRAAQR